MQLSRKTIFPSSCLFSRSFHTSQVPSSPVLSSPRLCRPPDPMHLSPPSLCFTEKYHIFYGGGIFCLYHLLSIYFCWPVPHLVDLLFIVLAHVFVDMNIKGYRGMLYIQRCPTSNVVTFLKHNSTQRRQILKNVHDLSILFVIYHCNLSEVIISCR